MDFRHLDATLLAALDILLQERSIARAGARLGLSQPAMDQIMRSLRHTLEDRLVERDGTGTYLTPKARELREGLAQHRHQIARYPVQGPEQGHAFDPTGCKEPIFLLGREDLVALAAHHLPGALAKAGCPAPLYLETDKASILSHFLGWTPLSLALTAVAPPSVEIQYDLLAVVHYVCLLGTGHPHADRPLDIDIFITQPQARFASLQGGIEDPVDEELAAQGLSRDVQVSVPSLSAAAALVAGGRHILTVPVTTARVIERMVPVVVRPLPVTQEGMTLHWAWHRRFDADPRNRWLRAVMWECLGPDLRNSV